MSEQESRYVLMIGLQVSDDKSYSRYRAGIAPLLKQLDGRFDHDFKMGEILKSTGDSTMNRIFVLSFPSIEAKTALFSDPAYKAIKAEHFVGAVSASFVLGEYQQVT